MIIRLTTYGFTLGALTATLLACAADNPERLSTVDASVAADGSSPSRADATPDLVAADFGLDAVASDSGAPDASVPPSPCDDLCTRFVGCATEQCGEGAAGQAESLDGLCQTACLESPAFATVGGGIETCGDFVEFARQSLPEAFSILCPEGPPPNLTYPVCDVFAERITSCIAEVCPSLEAVRAQTQLVYAQFCNTAANTGELNPEELARLITAQTPCDSPLVSQIVAEQTGAEGLLEVYCASGGLTTPEECTEACALLGPCVPEGGDGEILRDAGTCQYFCLVGQDPPPAVWSCAAALPDGAACEQVFGCFQLAPPISHPGCEGFTARALACLQPDCPAAADHLDALTGVIRGMCNGYVADDPTRGPGVDAVGPETVCEDEHLSSALGALLADDPMNPDDGGFSRLCLNGPAHEPLFCTDACAELGPCIPAGGDGEALRDPAFCELYCALGDAGISEMQWACVDLSTGCDAVFACFPQ